MLAFKLDIIKRSLSWTADVLGLLVGVVKAVDLAKCFEESGVDVFVDVVVGALNSFVVELDNMM
eukprot:10282949-Ditylum_brightwellii.AAC.1